MKGLQRRVWLTILLLGLVSAIWLGGCKTGSTLPEQDIVFEGVSNTEEHMAFGLVNADGSNLEYLEFRQPVALWHAKFPVWSPDKTKIVYLMTYVPIGGSGDLLWVDVAQAEANAVCASSSSETKAWRITDRPRWTPDGRWSVAATFEHGIGLINPETCEVEQVLVPHPEDKLLLSPDLSVRNELVYAMVLLAEAPQSLHNVELGHILVKDLNTGETRELGRGMVPSWSPDGEWIVFTKQDGLYLMRRDGSEEHRLLQVTPWWEPENAFMGPLRASWSPDGQWVVYDRMVHRDGGRYWDIYKLNVNTGEEVKLVEGGLSPHWHWGPKSMADSSQ